MPYFPTIWKREDTDHDAAEKIYFLSARGNNLGTSIL